MYLQTKQLIGSFYMPLCVYFGCFVIIKIHYYMFCSKIYYVCDYIKGVLGLFIMCWHNMFWVWMI